MFEVILTKNNETIPLIILATEQEAQDLIAERIQAGVFGEVGTYELSYSNVEAREIAKKESADAKAYLLSTDWLIIREMDSGVQCPADVKSARAAARLKVIS